MSSQMISFSVKKWEELSNHEIQYLYQLRSDVFVVEQKCVYLDPDITDLDALHVFAAVDGQLKGYARLYEDASWHIGRVIISENSRKLGIGRKLMDTSIKTVLDLNNTDKELSISAQVYLSEFYRSIGFEIKGSMYLEDGIPHLKMVFNES